MIHLCVQARHGSCGCIAAGDKSHEGLHMHGRCFPAGIEVKQAATRCNEHVFSRGTTKLGANMMKHSSGQQLAVLVAV